MANHSNYSVNHVRRIMEEFRHLYLVCTSCMIVVAAIALVANVYIVALFCFRIRQRWNPTLRITLSLAVADCWSVMLLALGLLVNSLLPSGLGIRFVFHLCLAILQEIFRLGAIITCIGHLLLLAIHHYVSIARPNHVNDMFRPKMLRIIIVGLWFIPMIMLASYFSSIPDAGVQEMIKYGGNATCRNIEFLKSVRFRATFVITLVTVVAVMGTLYCLMIRELTRLQMNFKRDCITSQSFRRCQSTIARKRRAMRTTFLILGSFLMCWVPASVIFLLTSTELYYRTGLNENPKSLFAMALVVNLLVVIKHLLNPILYAMRIPEIQRVARPSIALTWNQRTRPVLRIQEEQAGEYSPSPPGRELPDEPLLLINQTATSSEGKPAFSGGQERKLVFSAGPDRKPGFGVNGVAPMIIADDELDQVLL